MSIKARKIFANFSSFLYCFSLHFMLICYCSLNCFSNYRTERRRTIHEAKFYYNSLANGIFNISGLAICFINIFYNINFFPLVIKKASAQSLAFFVLLENNTETKLYYSKIYTSEFLYSSIYSMTILAQLF